MRTALLLPLLLALTPALADTAEAEALLREGRAAEAVAALQEEDGEAAHYWRGRALIAIGRMQDAAAQLRQVPDQSPLYPYAAKALLYCAWQCPELNFPNVVTPLTISRHEEIAHLATAALAEYRLMNGTAEGNAALDLLRSQAATRPELNAVLHLLDVRELRLQGRLQEAEQRCRKLEQERDLPTAIRHRARLELAEIYYERERQEDAEPEHEEEAEDAALHVTNAHGTGEETLLHFISSYADSPLLPEAIRRLAVHHAFEESEYARNQLKEWGEDTRYPRRASIALYIRQHLLNAAADADKLPDSTCVNTAIASYPNEPVTEAMILEQARWLIDRGEEKEANLYLQMVQTDSPRKSFLTARLLPQNTQETAEAYLDSAAAADPELRRAALCNALLCALRTGNDELADRVMECSPADADALMAVTIGFHLENGETAAAETEMKALEALTEKVSADIVLDRIYLALATGDTHAAAEQLNNLPKEAETQRERLFALQEACCIQNGTPQEAMLDQLKAVVQGSDTLTLALAERYLDAGQPQAALELQQKLLGDKELRGDLLQETLYMAARASEQLNTLPALLRAAELYEHCAATDPAAGLRATIRQAAVLARIGKTQEALSLLDSVNEVEELREEDRVLMGLVRSVTLMLVGTDEARVAAAEAMQPLLQERPQLERKQQYMVLLHHGAVCSRLGKAEEALRCYTEALALKSPTPSPKEWEALNIAAAGAIAKYEQLERFEEAALLADTVAGWNNGAKNEQTAQFAAWAQYLRQTHFLKSPRP